MDGQKLVVMVVDDSDDVRELVAMQLRFSGYDVVEARDGQEAVDLARAKCPALIVMDLHMPILDGLSATRLIRQMQGMCGTPIVAFSAFGSEYRQQALDAGCDEFVSKTKGIGELSAIVRQRLTAA